MDNQTPPPPDNKKEKKYQKKRKIEGEDNADDPEPDLTGTDQTTQQWPRFLIMEATNAAQPLTAVSPFAIAKGIQGLAGHPKQVTKLASGVLLIEVSTRAHCENLLRSTSIVNVPVRIAPHKTLNFSKGVIRTRDLSMLSDAEISTELRSQGVTDVHNVTQKRDGVFVKTNVYFLTFDRPELPTSIFAGYMRIRVDAFVPNPLRCFQCQRFGHHRDKCKGKPVCTKCGQEGHNYETCTNETLCINCQGSHSASDRRCPTWLVEKDIQIYKIKNNVTFKAAREAVKASSAPAAGKSYAKAVGTIKMVDSGCDACTPDDIKLEIQRANSAIIGRIVTSKTSDSSTDVPDLPNIPRIKSHPKSNTNETGPIKSKPTKAKKPNIPPKQKKASEASEPSSGIRKFPPKLHDGRASLDPILSKNIYDTLDNEDMDVDSGATPSASGPSVQNGSGDPGGGGSDDPGGEKPSRNPMSYP